MDTGTSIELLSLEFQIPESTQPGSHCTFAFSDSTPPVFANTGGRVRPYVHIHTLTVSGGPAMSGTVVGDSDFPEPTAEELEPQGSSAASGGFGAMGFAGEGEELGGYASEFAYCQYEEKGDELETAADGYQEVPVGDTTMAALQTAVNNARLVAQSVDTVVIVSPGTYVGTLTISVSGIQKHLVIASQNGRTSLFQAPTILQGDGTGPTVQIVGNATASGGRLSFGWHEQNDVNPLPPSAAGGNYLERGWRGFQIVGGAPGTGYTQYRGCNVYITGSAPGGIEVRGHWIHDNVGIGSGDAGGGIIVESSQDVDVQIVRNEINSCESWASGGGIVVFSAGFGTTTIAKNYIHDNELLWSGPSTGGGIYARRSTDLCGNFIYGNRAAHGCGVYLEYTDTSAQRVFYVEDNEIHHNVPALDGGKGGGISIRGSGASQGGWQLGFVRNKVYVNGEGIPTAYRVSSGGGVYLDVDFGDGLGPFGILDPLNE